MKKVGSEKLKTLDNISNAFFEFIRAYVIGFAPHMVSEHLFKLNSGKTGPAQIQMFFNFRRLGGPHLAVQIGPNALDHFFTTVHYRFPPEDLKSRNDHLFMGVISFSVT